jgi:hypothetical protein
MEHPESTDRPGPRPDRKSQAEALEQLGGEPLIGSGFETEQPEMAPAKGTEDDAR